MYYIYAVLCKIIHDCVFRDRSISLSTTNRTATPDISIAYCRLPLMPFVTFPPYFFITIR